jgi:hypothetical protein
MACGGFPESFPVLDTEGPLARRPREAEPEISYFLKNYIAFPPAWQEIVDFS